MTRAGQETGQHHGEALTNSDRALAINTARRSRGHQSSRQNSGSSIIEAVKHEALHLTRVVTSAKMVQCWVALSMMSTLCY